MPYSEVLNYRRTAQLSLHQWHPYFGILGENAGQVDSSACLAIAAAGTRESQDTQVGFGVHLPYQMRQDSVRFSFKGLWGQQGDQVRIHSGEALALCPWRR